MYMPSWSGLFQDSTKENRNITHQFKTQITSTIRSTPETPQPSTINSHHYSQVHVYTGQINCKNNLAVCYSYKKVRNKNTPVLYLINHYSHGASQG